MVVHSSCAAQIVLEAVEERMGASQPPRFFCRSPRFCVESDAPKKPVSLMVYVRKPRP
jgi:hypothetical protein